MLTLMAVHAHPDDEATTTGGVLAKYAAENVRTVLVTCTDGRCGDGPGGVKPGDQGHDPKQVVAMRNEELRASCAILGISNVELLGYGDSGMMGWPHNDEPGSFWSTPVDEGAAKLAELINHYQPDVIVTYDPNGFYGHPDHIQAHRITMAAVEQTGSQAKVYWTAMPASAVRPMFESARQTQFPEIPDAEFEELVGWFSEYSTPDEQVSTWVDVKDFALAKFDALSSHASQSDHAIFLGLGRELFTDVMGVETFRRVDASAPNPAIRETDLFA